MHLLKLLLVVQEATTVCLDSILCSRILCSTSHLLSCVPNIVEIIDAIAHTGSFDAADYRMQQFIGFIVGSIEDFGCLEKGC